MREIKAACAEECVPFVVLEGMRMADRDKSGRFLPGHKILSDGRPKIPDNVKEALRAASPEAVRVLIELLHDKKPIIRLEAAKVILDRAYGKPEAMSKIELSGQNQPVVLFRWMTDEEASTITPQNAEINSKDE